METFEIILKTFDHARKVSGTYRFIVEVLYNSEQVQRFKLSAGNKELTLEKNLLQSSTFHKNWRITDINFVMGMVNESTVMALHDIYKKIDENMEGKRSIAYQRQEL